MFSIIVSYILDIVGIVISCKFKVLSFDKYNLMLLLLVAYPGFAKEKKNPIISTFLVAFQIRGVTMVGALIELEMKARWWEMDPSSIISAVVNSGGFGI